MRYRIYRKNQERCEGSLNDLPRLFFPAVQIFWRHIRPWEGNILWSLASGGPVSIPAKTTPGSGNYCVRWRPVMIEKSHRFFYRYWNAAVLSAKICFVLKKSRFSRKKKISLSKIANKEKCYIFCRLSSLRLKEQYTYSPHPAQDGDAGWCLIHDLKGFKHAA